VNQCTYDTHSYDAEDDVICSRDENCVNCQRCVTFCPTHAITIRKNPNANTENANWTLEAIRDVKKQAETGGVILTGMGCDKPYFTYWDRLLLNASQVTNPSIDPLREPMEIRTYLGAKPDKLEMELENGSVVLKTELTPQLCLDTPIMFSAMSYGAISLNVHEALARAATECGTYFNTGEGGLDQSLYKYGDHAIVQVASGRFGVHTKYLDIGAAVEIKIGQGAKPGIGGHLPGEKVTADVARTRMIPTGTDALSPAPQHDIYSIEDLRQLIYALKEATDYTKPISVKIAAVHNSAAIASGMVRAGADIIA
jgi:glutamate synthase domain-containing protein 2